MNIETPYGTVIIEDEDIFEQLDDVVIYWRDGELRMIQTILGYYMPVDFTNVTRSNILVAAYGVQDLLEGFDHIDYENPLLVLHVQSVIGLFERLGIQRTDL